MPKTKSSLTSQEAQALADIFWESISPEPNSGCWLWAGPYTSSTGYGQIRVAVKPPRMLQATHVSLALVGNPVPIGMIACHKCDTPLCVNPAHLFVGTQQENILDCIRKGRAEAFGRNFPKDKFDNRGSAHPLSKLCEKDIIAIRAMVADGIPRTEAAKVYSIDISQICKIVKRKAWRHVV